MEGGGTQAKLSMQKTIEKEKRALQSRLNTMTSPDVSPLENTQHSENCYTYATHQIILRCGDNFRRRFVWFYVSYDDDDEPVGFTQKAGENNVWMEVTRE